MALYVQPLFEQAVLTFRSSFTHQNFPTLFIMAVNNALDDLNVAGDLSTSHTHIEETETSISTLDADDTGILWAGITFHLMDLGESAKDGDKAYERAERKWRDKQGDYMVKLSLSDQATVDDDDNPTSDIIGLGYKS